MLDHQPDRFEVATAEEAFQQGRASSYDMEVLRFTHPYRDYGGDDPISDFFSIFDNPPWPF